MKIRILFTILFAFFISCKQTIKKTEIEYLNGYWEIVKVELPEGETKNFKVNETIDFFSFQDNKGHRNKVIPQLDGTILSSSVLENFTIIEKNDAFYFEYKTNYASWKEELITMTKEKLVVKNSNDLVYYYKKRDDLNMK
jgi:hypothetical protein